MVTSRKNALNGLKNQLFSGTEIHLARWFWVATVQWVNFFEPSLPPKVSPYKGIRKAIMNQYNLGMGNLFRGILSVRWRQIQDKYLKKKFNENVRADEWAAKISKSYIDFSVQMWKTRCQIVHATSVGTSDHAFRLLSMEVLKKLKEKVQYFSNTCFLYFFLKSNS